MRVLVGCEYSGVVRDAFRARGHEAMSCDLLPTERPGPHYQGNVLDVIGDGWDLAVFHPPCTHLAVSGARWFKDKVQDQAEALDFVRALLAAPIPRIALENPVSVISSRIAKPTQIIQPWQFGHGETKATCLWLLGLPPLTPTNIVSGRENRVHRMPPGPDRWKERSRTFQGVADAMASQWGGLPALGSCFSLSLAPGRPSRPSRASTVQGGSSGGNPVVGACASPLDRSGLDASRGLCTAVHGVVPTVPQARSTLPTGIDL